MGTLNREFLILQLLTSLHLNNNERVVFIDNPIKLFEVVTCIQNELKQNSTFPPVVLEHEGFEGYYIKKLDNDSFELVCQRNNPLDPFNTVEILNKRYTNFKELIFDYLNKAFDFNIDGIMIKK